MTRLTLPTGPVVKADPSTLMAEYMAAVYAWQGAMEAVRMCQMAMGDADDPTTLDAARTAMWQACDMLDAALADMMRTGNALTEHQRRQIRVERMAGVTVGRKEEA